MAKELKRIRALQEDKENKSKDKKEKKKKSEEEAAEEEMGLQGASADDQEAEFIMRLCEKEIVSPPNLLSCFFKFIIYVCQVRFFFEKQNQFFLFEVLLQLIPEMTDATEVPNTGYSMVRF